VKMSHKVSVREDILKVEVYSDGHKVFKATAPASNKKKVAKLIKILETKGVNINKDLIKDSWW